jgi:hypothetical protein
MSATTAAPDFLQSSCEALQHELVQYRLIEDELRQQIYVRSAALKQEEASIRKQLDAVLIKHEGLHCEHVCLEAILRDDKPWVVDYQAWYVSAVKASRSASMERMSQNVWLANETERLQSEIDALERDNGWHAQGASNGNVDAQVVREASGRFASRSERTLQCLETNAQVGRERYSRAMEKVGKDITTLRGGIVAMRNYLREVYPAEAANELIVWAESGGRIARGKARWDFQNPICPLDLVMLEGLRLRLAELA